MLEYKYLLSTEGVDTDSDLLWKLFSNSLLFMPNVTHVSWSMETLLEEYVHFVPVQPNMMNVESQIRWAQNHPVQARKIVERSTLFVYDLLFHPESAIEEEEIMRRMIHRYHQYVLKAKPIRRWNTNWTSFYGNLLKWYHWFREDWLRLLVLGVFLLCSCL